MRMDVRPPVLPPHTLAPERAPKRLVLTGVATISIAAGLVPAGAFARTPAAVGGVISGSLIFGLLFFAIGWRFRRWWLALLPYAILGPLAGIFVLETYRALRWGKLEPEGDNVLHVDTIFGLIVGAFWMVLLLLARERHAVAYDMPDRLQRSVGAVLVAAGAIVIGFLLSDRPEARWGWGIAAGILGVTGTTFVLASTRRRTTRRAWLGRVVEGREPGWSVAPSTEADDALPPLERPAGAYLFDRVLVHTEEERSPGSAFRDAPSRTRVARIAPARAE
jgi:hypothetical protein